MYVFMYASKPARPAAGEGPVGACHTRSPVNPDLVQIGVMSALASPDPCTQVGMYPSFVKVSNRFW